MGGYLASAELRPETPWRLWIDKGRVGVCCDLWQEPCRHRAHSGLHGVTISTERSCEFQCTLLSPQDPRIFKGFSTRLRTARWKSPSMVSQSAPSTS